MIKLLMIESEMYKDKDGKQYRVYKIGGENDSQYCLEESFKECLSAVIYNLFIDSKIKGEK